MANKFLNGINVTGTTTLNTVANAGTDTDKFLVLDASGNVDFRTGDELYADLGIGSLPAGFTSTVKHAVKAGVALTKGQAVYVTGADGTNMIVGKASNASEATSSKTMGLIETTLSINGIGNVITEGLLTGLDTTGAAAAGDPVWLGTDGNLIYGLTNKPYAPAHLVFIGIVTRINANNGEIFVKVQNGFELNEIHDVDLKTTTPINGHILGYNGTLWVNKTIAGWLGFTPADDSLVVKLAGAQTITGAKSFDSPITLNSGIGFLNGVMPNITSNLYSGIGGNSNGISIITRPVSTNYTNNLYFAASNNSFTFPNATGTLALTSDIPSITGLVPYTGATANVNLGSFELNAILVKAITLEAKLNGTASGNLTLRTGTNGYGFGNDAFSLASSPDYDNTLLLISNKSAVTKTALININSLTIDRTFTLPNLSGTLALLEGSQTFSGSKTFSVTTIQDAGIVLKDGVYPSPSTGYVGFASNGVGITIVRRSGVTSYNNNLQFPLASNDYNFPNATGTIALTSDLTAYVPTSRTLTINGVTYDLSANRSWTIEAGGTSASTRTIQKFTSTASQTTFTITGGYTVGMVDVWVNGVKLDNAVDFTASNGTTVVLTDALTANQIVEVYKYGSQFIVNNGLRQKTLFTATAGQTSFTVAYSVGLVDVFYNGSKLDDSEFTATNGTSIVLGTACAVNDKVEVIAFSYNVNGFTGIGGSGTTNNLPKFTAAGTIGDSAITDDGTTVTLVSRALAGTSATFSGQVDIVKSIPILLLKEIASRTTGTRGEISWDNSASTTVAAIRATALTDNVGTSLEFYTRPVGSGGLSKTFDIASTGAASFSESINIANATANLTNQKLSVNGGLGVSGINLGNMTGIGGLVAGFMYLPISGGINFRSANGAIGYATIQADASSNILISGNLGVGGITPVSMLHISETTSGNFTASCRIGGNDSNFGVVTNYTQSAATSGSIYVSPGYTNSGILFKLGAGGGNTNQLVLSGNGNVGIGTSGTPARKLDVFSDGAQFGDGGSFTFFMNVGAGAATGVSWVVNSVERMRIMPSGQVGIGTANSGWTLAVNSLSSNNPSTPHQLAIFGNNVSGAIRGYLYIGSSSGIDWLVGKDTSGSGDARFNLSLYTGEQRMTLYTNGQYSFAGSNVSDIRLKSNINIISINALDKISQFVPKSYYMTDNPEQIRYGFIAQEVRNILPDLISGEEKEKEYLGLDYNGVLTLAVKAIQELKAEIEQLKQK
jgi:hypothetical protein